MMGIENTGKIPFDIVYLHGLIRDEKGEKMSKTKGNVVDPLGLMEQYGTDALRFALLMGTSPGNDSRLSPEKMEAGRNFANKLWNATRFVVRNLDSGDTAGHIRRDTLTPEDRWILSRLNRTAATVTRLIDDFQFGEAQRQIHDFLWGELCDWYIEFAKIRLASGGQSSSPLKVLVHVLEKSLRLLHPYMPFLTEELWQNLKQRLGWPETDSIMVTVYPEADDSMTDPAAEAEIEAIIEIIRSIRNVRAQYKVESKRWIEVKIHTDPSLQRTIASYIESVKTLARANPVTFLSGEPREETVDSSLVLPLTQATVVIPMASMLDLEAEKKRVQKETAQVEAEVGRLESRLQDQAFLTRAPAAVIEKERQKLYTLNDKLEKLRQQSSRL
jgi:valyl-tRNA synthetase